MTQDLDQILEYLSEHLLGWERHAIDVNYTDDWWTCTKCGDAGRPVFMRGFCNHYGNELLTGNGMREIIEAMQKVGLKYSFWQPNSTAEHWAEFYPIKPSKEWMKKFPVAGQGGLGPRVFSDNLPEAVARAAHAALTSQNDG
jgi:hypothetical protein